jgi:hypothetical protein
MNKQQCNELSVKKLGQPTQLMNVYDSDQPFEESLQPNVMKSYLNWQFHHEVKLTINQKKKSTPKKSSNPVEKYGNEVPKSLLKSIYGPSDDEIYDAMPDTEELRQFMVNEGNFANVSNAFKSPSSH